MHQPTSPFLSVAAGGTEAALIEETIGANLAATVAAHGDREALVDVPSGRRWTYAELLAEVASDVAGREGVRVEASATGSDLTVLADPGELRRVLVNLTTNAVRHAGSRVCLDAVAAQARWQELLGAQHSYFCGAYWANGFHEDGVVSALRVAQAFGQQL